MAPATDWRPGASLATLRQRAQLVERLRQFFARRGVLEVETPLLSRAASTEVHLQSWRAQAGEQGPLHYLHTSPELFMKRLLAAGSGDIYQICKVFRADECGRYHNPEFTLLEWYRLGFDLARLCEEVETLLQEVLEPLALQASQSVRYREIFQAITGLDPLQADAAQYQALYAAGGGEPVQALSAADWRDLVFGVFVQPALPSDRLVFVTHFPAAQASLAKLDPAAPEYALRFEVFCNGLELANGFEELTDPEAQRRRITQEQAQRAAAGLPVLPVDERFLAALAAGLPPCSGVALGVDRLVMLALGAPHFADVVSFDATRS